MRLPLNQNLEDLPVYQPGRPIEEVARELGMNPSDILKLASNENPLGPSPRVVEAVREFAPKLHLYPDGGCYALRGALAERLGVAGDHLIFGSGSNELIEFVGHALLEPGTNIVVSEYCFAIYPIVAKLFGAEVKEVPSVGYGADLKAMREAVDARTRIVFVANPNNPTGTLCAPEEVEAFVESIPEETLVVIDEAYVEYLERPPSLIARLADSRFSNLLLMRTFSKIHGLAGLRIGYGIGRPELISQLEKIRQPFNINALAQVAALAALEDDGHVAATTKLNAEELQYLAECLRERRIEFVPSYANFLLMRVGDGAAIARALQERGVIVRPVGAYQLPEWIRVTAGTRQENEIFVDALDEVTGRPSLR